eukprot:gene8038-1272_t
MAAATAGNPIDLCFEKLATCIRNSQHKKALKAADEVLAIEPKNVDALSCKVASLIQQGDYVSALSVLSKMPAGSMPFEKAYCLYRTSKLEEGLEACKTISEEDAECRLQLEAQIHYRLGQNKDCIQLYDSLFQQHKTNVLAAYVAAGLAAEVPALLTAMKVTPKQSFEIGYNKACSLVEAGDWSAAEGDLRMALKTVAYNNSVAESGKVDASSNHKKYVASATKRMEAMLDNSGGEIKPSQTKMNPSLESRLSPHQKQTFNLNRALLYLLAGRLEPAKGVMAELGKVYEETVPLALMRAALLLADGGSSSLLPTLMRAQMAMESNSTARALELLTSLPKEDANRGAVLATRLALHQQLGDSAGAESLLESGISSWQQRNTDPGASDTLSCCFQNLVQLKLKLGKVEDAMSRAQALVQAIVFQQHQCPRGWKLQGSGAGAGHSVSTASVLARLARAMAVSDPASVQPPPNSLTLSLFLPQLPYLAEAAGLRRCYRTLQKLQGSGAGAGHSVSTASVLARLARAMAVSDPASVQPPPNSLTLSLFLPQLPYLAEAAGLRRCYRTLQKLQGSGAGAGHSVSTASVLARLARAMAVSDPSSVPALVSKEMPAISAAELKGLNLDLLEDSLATRGNTATASKLPVPKKDLENMKSDGMVVDVEQIKKFRTKRKRKPVHPKGYNPELPDGGL